MIILKRILTFLKKKNLDEVIEDMHRLKDVRQKELYLQNKLSL